MPRQPSDRWNEGLRLVSYCPVCDMQYNNVEAKILGEDGDTRLVHVCCKKCRHSVLALVLVNQVGVSSVGLLTDLTYEDVLQFRSSKRVTVKDVIDIHTVLEDGTWKMPVLPASKRSRVAKQAKHGS